MSARSTPLGTSKPRLHWAVGGVACAVIAACGGGSGGTAPPAADTTPPTALSSVPLNSASQVATQTGVSVTFSEAMDAASLSAATFTLSAAGAAAGATVAGSVSASGSTASFTPAAALSAGTRYTATVSVGAKDAAGNALVAAHGWRFTTVASVARAWSVPVLLESGAAEARTPTIAATSEDVPTGAVQATAVWVQDGSVYANRYQGGVWQGSELIENETTEATSPRVAMGTMGRTVITWGFGFNGVYSVWGNVYDPIPPGGGQDLSFSRANARQLSAGGNASSPQVGFDGSGHDAFAVWTQYVPDRQPAAYHPAQQRYLFVPCDVVVGCVWKTEDFGWRDRTLLEVGGTDASDPQVAGFGSGNAVAAWRKYQAGVWASSHTKAGGWSAAVQVTPGSSTTADKVVVAAAPDGSTAVVLWIDNSTRRSTVYASRRSGSAWSAPVAIDNAAAGPSDDPQVAIDALGNAMIVWQQGGDVYARRCPTGDLSGCGAAALIENSSGDARFPRLAAAPNGDAVVAWRETGASGSTPRVYASHYVAASAAWVSSAVLIGDASDFNEGPDVAMDKRGRATVVWSKQDAAGKTNVYASRLE